MTVALLQAEDCQRYQVRHAHSIERILKGIMETRGRVSIHSPEGEWLTLSSIIAVDTDHGRLLLEQGVDQRVNRRLIEAGRAVCGSLHEQVYVQFAGQDVRPVQHADEVALQMAMPRELIRLQRREAYRLETSVVQPVKCLINTGLAFVEAVVVDISIGGVGILAYEGLDTLQTGATYHGCRIELPGAGTFALSLNVRTTFDVTLRNGRITHRAGCQFIDLPASVETEIQRYINRVERERRSRFT